MEKINYQSLLTYIGLAFFVVIMIYLLFKQFYKKKKTTEQMSNQSTHCLNSCSNYGSNTGSDSFYSRDIQSVHQDEQQDEQQFNIIKSVQSVNKNDREYESYEDDKSLENNEMVELSGSVGDNNINQPEYDTNQINGDNTYTREFMLNNDMPIPTEPISYTENEMQDYRNDFFNFRNKTNQSSQGVDSTELLNENILSNNGNIYDVNAKAKKGQKISEIYDGLTIGQYQNIAPTDTVTSKDHIAPNYDRVTHSPQFKTNGGNGSFFTNDNWMYKTDNVMNGGEFLDGITGSDSYHDNNMAISY